MSYTDRAEALRQVHHNGFISSFNSGFDSGFDSERRRTAAGSALIVCLVFLSVVSSLALSALDAAWSGQRMISAYISHQQSLRVLEQELRQAERMVWQQIDNLGLAEFLLSAQNYEGSATAPVTTVNGSWINTGFSGLQCGPLFQITVLRPDHAGGRSGLSVYWEVCCESQESCLANQFAQQRRLQSRWPETLQ